MKKQNTALLFAGVVLAGMLLFFACNNSLSPSADAGSAQGNVTVSLSAGPSGRTLMPSALDFDLYEFTFTNDSYKGFFTVEKGTDAISGSFTFSVPSGDGYTLNVTAYKGTGEGKIPAAEGSSSAPFSVNGATAVTIKLTGNLRPEETGTFSYYIQYPSNSWVERFVLVGPDGEIDLLGAEIKEGSANVMTDSAEITAGWYGLELDLKDADGKVAYVDDMAVIFSDTTTFYGAAGNPIVISSAKFKGKSTGVYSWHGFDILTNPRDGKYPEGWYSKGIGTQYPSIEMRDNDGNIKTYYDVLKVEPPANADPGFYEGVVLSYKTTENATYRFEMEMWYEMPPGKIPGGTLEQEGAGSDGYISWQHWTAPLTWPWESWTTGEWLPVCFEVSNSGMSLTPENIWDAAQGQIVYLQGNYKNGDAWANDGLLYGTAYIRDIKVTKKTGGVEVVENESYLNGRTPPKPLWVSHTRATLAPGEFLFYDGNMASKGMIWITTYPNTNVTCTSDNPEIASVEYYTEGGLAANWKINAHAVGETTIRLTHISGQTAEVAIKVEEPRDKNAEKKYVVLTFDDGPFSGTTDSILNTLKENGAAGTFYLVGNRVNERPDLVRRMMDEGHGIGNHTMTHYSGGANRWDDQEYADWEYTEGQKTINKVVSSGTYAEGHHRQPTATYNPMIVKAAKDAGKALMGAGEICFDWRGFDGDYLASTIQTIARPWGIINMHDFNGGTAEAVKKFVPAMMADGWVFVTIEEMMLAKRATSLEPGYIYEYFGDDLKADPAFDMSRLNVKGIKLSHDNISLTAGDSKAVIATVLPRVANNLNVIWTTSDPAVATVADGVITGTGGGTAQITATTVEGGKTASVTVNVIGSTQGGTLTTWSAFYWPGWDGYLSSYASGEVLSDYMPGDGYIYSNVLKLSPPAGGYKNAAGGIGSSAMTFTVTDTGTYTISMDVWVETDKPVIDMVWVENRGWGLFNPRGGITAGYNHISGSQYVEAGSVIGLIALSGDGTISMKDATIYFKNLKLERVSAADPVIDIQGASIGGGWVNPDLPKKVTEWNGFDILTDPTDGKYYPGWYARALGTEYSSVTVPGDSAISNNVLKLNPVYAAYEGVLLIYPTPENAAYDFTMKIWVDGNPGEVINWQYYYAPGGGGHPSFTYQSVPTNGWVTLHWQFTNTGIDNPDLLIGGEQNPQGQIVYLQAGNGGMKYTAYIKDVVVKKNGVVISDSNAAPGAGVILEWDDDDFSILDSSITINRGETVTIAPRGNFSSYEWKMDGKPVGENSSYEFTGTSAGTYKLLLWVTDIGSGKRKGASISITVK